jgi:diguanylate cyclase (GGDEF)-like protein
VISLDMDKFKLINDTYGHPLGDQALIQVGNRLSGCLRTSDTCARIGGDEFGFIADGLKSEQDLDVVIQKLTQSLRSEFILEGKTFHISASMGASLFPEHGADLEELMSAADKALYQAKNTGSGYRVFRKGEQYSLLQE